MNLYEKLIEIRKACPYLQKDNKGYQFAYVSSSQTLGSLRAKMDELKVLLIPRVSNAVASDKPTQKGAFQMFTQLWVEYTWVNAENPEETITCSWYGQGLDTGEKGVGKALTYSEKYFMLKFFNIATDEDDPDSFQDKGPSKAKSTPQTTPQAQTNLATDKQKKMVWAKCNAKKLTTAEAKALCVEATDKDSSKKWTKEDIRKILDKLDTQQTPKNYLIGCPDSEYPVEEAFCEKECEKREGCPSW
jgi:hypothetical protein